MLIVERRWRKINGWGPFKAGHFQQPQVFRWCLGSRIDPDTPTEIRFPRASGGMLLLGERHMLRGQWRRLRNARRWARGA